MINPPNKLFVSKMIISAKIRANDNNTRIKTSNDSYPVLLRYSKLIGTKYDSRNTNLRQGKVIYNEFVANQKSE